MSPSSQVHRGPNSRIWLKQYPAGVPADIDATPYASLLELLEESFAAFRSRRAFIELWQLDRLVIQLSPK
jgi:hypothetical protein